MKLLFLCGLIICTSIAANEQDLAKIYADFPQTFFCSCQFEAEKMQLLENNCLGQELLSSPFAEKVRWASLIPAHEFSNDLQCWHEPESFSECRNNDGGNFLSPQSCCRKVSEEYRIRESNLHNLIPVMAKIDKQRQNLSFSQVYNTESPYSACNLKLDPRARKIEPKDNLKGDIARIFFYFESLGYIRLSHRARPLMEIWDMKDPVNDSECMLHDKKAALSGLKNPYVANRCR